MHFPDPNMQDKKCRISYAMYLLFLMKAAPVLGIPSDNPSNCEAHISTTKVPPVIDGVLNETEWQTAAVLKNFIQKEPVEGEPASEITVAYIYYDQNNIFFGVRCFDKNPNAIVASEMRRDESLSENDYVEILIDTYHDQRNAFYFATNSVGARLDCEVKNEGKLLNWNWDGVWTCAATRDSLGWTAEMAIPFQTLRFDNSQELSWGINLGRYIPRKREEAYWAPISRNDDFDDQGKFKPSKFGTLHGLRNISQACRLQLKPYSIGGAEWQFNAGQSERVTDVGIDAKFHLTPNITSDLTINTDFAQVEADAEQVNIGRFSLFYPEKRDFFVEGLDFFKIGEGSSSNPFALLFFSRNIGIDPGTGFETPIIGGLKTTGKAGSYELGVLNVLTNSIDVESEKRHVPKTNFSAIRLKRDIFSRSSVGMMFLDKEPFQGNHNRTFAADANLSFENNLSISGYLAKTQTPGLSGKDFNTYLKAGWGNDRYYTFASFTTIGENFNPEMGFMQWRRRNIRKYQAYGSFSPRPNFGNIRKTQFSAQTEIITDQNNGLLYRTIQPGIWNIFKDESYIFLAVTNYYDMAPDFSLGRSSSPIQVPAGIYKYSVWGLSYLSDRSKELSGGLRVGNGGFYGGTFTGVTVNASWRPNKGFGLDFSWQRNWVDLPGGEFAANLVRTQLKYSFTPDLYIKADVQWNELQERFTSKILLNYIPRSGSDLFLVYSDLWETVPALSESNRTLLGKFTYMFDF